MEHRADASVRTTHALLPGEDISVRLQHYVEAEVQRGNIRDPVGPARILDLLLSSMSNAELCSPAERESILCPGYLQRIAQVAHERYAACSIVQDVPTMIIVPEPLTRQQTGDLLGSRLNYVLVFGAESIYFQDTVHAFSVDSRCFGGVNVLGSHFHWLSSDGRSATRALVVDETGVVKELAFEEPVPVNIVQILHLPLNRERQTHKELSLYFRNRGIRQVNPYDDSSERADDKAWTHRLWDQYGQKIVSPKHVLILQDSSPEEIVGRLRFLVENTGKQDLVAQTNGGTEGYKVEEFSGISAERLDSSSPIVAYVEDQVLPEDDAIVREMRGNVRYKSRPSGPLLALAFRVNVAWNGSGFVAESGYAQVAKDTSTFPASRGRGGTIVDINEALTSLYYPMGGRWVRFIPTNEDVAAMKGAATRAARGLNAGLDVEDYLKHMGIDILLEVEESKADTISVVPVALEANPRPAGLSQSSEIIGISDENPQPRISTEIFRSLASSSRTRG